MEDKRQNSLNNLKPIRTTERAKEIGSEGGRRSGEEKRKRKSFREAVDAIMKACVKNPNGDLAKAIFEENKGSMTHLEAIVAALTIRAENGDVSAATWLRDTVGEKPTDKAETDTTVRVVMGNDIKEYSE